TRSQNLFADEIFENGSSGNDRDATLEEVLHLVTDLGWDEAFPDIWGERKGSSVANGMQWTWLVEVTLKMFPHSTRRVHGTPMTTKHLIIQPRSPSMSIGQQPPISVLKIGKDATIQITPMNGHPIQKKC
ncbi:MAG: hypothetical protein EBS13_08805, partial [Verrucomicrobia bacterium]|nr:hypothetical protein [Verrucomicrobiota bacterium]